MIMLQTPVPLPPAGPDPNLMVAPISEAIMMILLVIGFMVVALKVLGPMARAMARRMEGKVGDPELRGDVEQLREQLGEMDGLRSRVQELEERVEFTERLLAQKRDQELLPREGKLEP